MTTHIVMWNFKDELSKEERTEAGRLIKEKLEAVTSQVPGVIDLKVIINELESSNRDLMLYGTFETVEALNGYQIHPAHIVAATYVRSKTQDRICFDY